jgi:benzoylformate decarboxylase
VFRYFQYQPGPPIEEGTRIIHVTEDPEEAARSAAGSGIMGDVGLAIRGLIERLPERTHRPVPPPPSRPPQPEAREPLPADYVLHALARRLPEAAILVEETPSSKMLLHRHVRVKRPGGFYSAASGGLGFGASASVGLSMASPDRPVTCVVGDGSLMYAPQALWSAARYGANVAYVVLNNGQYGILKLLGQAGSEAPGLDLPNLDVLGAARSLGCEGETVKRPEDLDDALERALDTGRPYVLDVHVDPAFPKTLG